MPDSLDYLGSFNLGKIDDDDGSVSTVSTDPTPAKLRGEAKGRLGGRATVKALGDMVVTYADGTTKVVPKRKRGETNRTLAKRAREAKVMTEIERLGQAAHAKLSIEEIQAKNGL